MSAGEAVAELRQVLNESGVELICARTTRGKWGRRRSLSKLEEPEIRELIRLAREAARRSNLED